MVENPNFAFFINLNFAFAHSPIYNVPTTYSDRITTINTLFTTSDDCNLGSGIFDIEKYSFELTPIAIKYVLYAFSQCDSWDSHIVFKTINKFYFNFCLYTKLFLEMFNSLILSNIDLVLKNYVNDDLFSNLSVTFIYAVKDQ
jgi:hypothetical protein